MVVQIQASKIVTYAVLSNVAERASKLASYAVLSSIASDASKLISYAVLQPVQQPPMAPPAALRWRLIWPEIDPEGDPQTTLRLLRARRLAAPVNTKLVSSFIPSTLRSNFTGHVGMIFGVTARCVINKLGMWVNSGNTGVQTLSLWQWPGNDIVASTLLATTTVDLTGARVGTFAYTPLPGGFVLTPGIQYVIAYAATSGGIQWSNEGPVTLTPFAASGWMSADDSPASGRFENGPVGDTYVGLDVDYTLLPLVASVPRSLISYGTEVDPELDVESRLSRFRRRTAATVQPPPPAPVYPMMPAMLRLRLLTDDEDQPRTQRRGQAGGGVTLDPPWPAPSAMLRYRLRWPEIDDDDVTPISMGHLDEGHLAPIIPNTVADYVVIVVT